jgi:two-component system LytT family response regulator
MEKIRTIIIDDEIASTESLSIELKMYCPQVDIIMAVNDPIKGLEMIRSHNPDLLLLDIDMPGISGFDLLNSLDEVSFEVIFITAYDQFAIKAFKYSAMDYLLKPISSNDLIRSIEKVQQKIHLKKPVNTLQEVISNIKLLQNKSSNFAISTAEGIEFIPIDDIQYCEADKNYTYFHLLDKKKILLSKTLKEVESLLIGHDFVRIHQSYLVNYRYIKKYIRGQGGYVVLNNGDSLPVSRAKKDDFLSRIFH